MRLGIWFYVATGCVSTLLLCSLAARHRLGSHAEQTRWSSFVLCVGDFTPAGLLLTMSFAMWHIVAVFAIVLARSQRHTIFMWRAKQGNVTPEERMRAA